MTNKEIAQQFRQLGQLMELHGENPFKIRSYQSAYRTLRSYEGPLSSMAPEEIGQIKGVGKAISAKIQELLASGQMSTLEKYRSKTPEGIQEMLNIKGFGPKKIMAVWQGLQVESIGELLYAVNENRLVELKGFGKKTQEELRQKLEYYQKSKNRYHYAAVETEASQLLDALQSQYPQVKASLCGAIRRKAVVVSHIEILFGSAALPEGVIASSLWLAPLEQVGEGKWAGKTAQGVPAYVYTCAAEAFGSALYQLTATDDFASALPAPTEAFDNEEAIFQSLSVPFVAPELREQSWAASLARTGQLPALITEADIKGVVHAHTTYSDGANTLEEMARYAKAQGYEYLGLTDHSKSAFYANGLQPERVLQQMEEADALNKELAPFRIFKGIESDILNDGSLDYEEDLLKAFDFIIASVHSNLRMDEDKATARLITAIENPYTTILGHPTGRLLLSRKGYPIDHAKVIDACAANGVAIEINANPYRLDLDWSWAPYALEKGVPLCINPDAHSTAGIHDIRYGVFAARKGGLSAPQCLNALGVEAFAKAIGL
ncbi:DNA polymerase/3'-5' exonuclease PolX [Phaeodactylibacter luteus]|uniref:PHP domain-containing protein n=1 Tax=Phaeodactylibacter luteus TaxID=1564516 RepID=A0A5C6RWW5_9BACT|nr:DNA polymerase/3'-5' exonuclease PolX [Phaeodactylibacter luteus]TXB66577.1 PHP domain-containing protein [Phaeodactylibacter luteus]